MIPKRIKINGEVHDFEIPVNAKDLTLGQFVAIWKNKDKIDADPYISLEIFTGFGKDVWQHAKSKDVGELLILLKHVQKDIKSLDFEAFEVPKSVVLDGKEVKIPKNLDDAIFGAVETVAQLAGNVEDSTELLPTAIGNILCYNRYKEYDEERSMNLAVEAMNMPLPTGYALGSFFLQKLSDLSNTSKIDSVRSLAKQKGPQEPRSWLHTAFSLPLRTLRTAIGQKAIIISRPGT